jgi:hypothetical protein
MGKIGRRLLALAIVAASASPAAADKRVALVIGNGAYRNATHLPNPPNDARDVAAALGRIGFDTILGLDLDKAGMDEHAIRFARAARDADVALFYYSGHALQFAGVNYLVPVDAKLADEADLRRMTRVDDIVADLQQARNLRILVLDACRDNPLAEALKRSVGLTRAAIVQQGLAKIDSPQGMIVAYATQAGRTAEDGTGRNSPYTTAFLKHIGSPDEIGMVFRRIGTEVYEATAHAQLPELSLSLIGELYLRGRPAIATTTPSAAQPAETDRLAALPPPSEPVVRTPAATVVDPAAVGTWEVMVPNKRGVARWIWDIQPGGIYRFHAEGPGAVSPHEGTITVGDGRWSLRATHGLPGWDDGGPYEVRDPNTLVMTGRLGTGVWRRIDAYGAPVGGTTQRGASSAGKSRR